MLECANMKNKRFKINNLHRTSWFSFFFSWGGLKHNSREGFHAESSRLAPEGSAADATHQITNAQYFMRHPVKPSHVLLSFKKHPTGSFVYSGRKPSLLLDYGEIIAQKKNPANAATLRRH